MAGATEVIEPLLASVSDVTGVIGAATAVIGVPVLVLQMRRARKTTEGQSLTTLAQLVSEYKPLHTRLHPPPERWWTSPGTKPSKEDLVELEGYMGFFERLWLLVENKALTLDVVDRLYGYRVANIVNNPEIRKQKLEPQKAGWSDFIGLWGALISSRERSGRRQLFAYLPPDPKTGICPPNPTYQPSRPRGAPAQQAPAKKSRQA